MKHFIDPSIVVELLNELLMQDQTAIQQLIGHRVVCNKTLSNHPTVQVSFNELNLPVVGLLGLLNGLCGVDADGWGFIAAEYEGTSVDPGKLVKFAVREPWKPFERDPVHQADGGKWWFWDETWSDRIGPYTYEHVARDALKAYLARLEGQKRDADIERET